MPAKHALPLLLLACAAPTFAHAQSPEMRAQCPAIGEIARDVMEARQRGHSREEVEKLADRDDLRAARPETAVPLLADIAFNMPVHDDAGQREREPAAFQKRITQTCLDNNSPPPED